MADILIVDDEKRMGKLLKEELEDAGLAVDVESSGAGAMRRVQDQEYRVVVSDIRMAPPDGMEILRAVKEQAPATDVVMMTAYSSVQNAREAFKLGAADYLIKPFDLEEMRMVVQSILERQELNRRAEALALENRMLRDRLAGKEASTIVGKSRVVQELRRLIDLVAHSEATVLINGPSGAGKELVAREIHSRSARADRPFIAVNCAAIPDSLLESELFGHEKGAFTGADARKPGRFELAQGGTIFLDEIGEMGAEVQAKLLRVLEERKVSRLGSTSPIDVDLRVVAATNRNLEDDIRVGRFREDLFYRLNVFPVEAPPLAARREDVPLLVEFFLREMRYASLDVPQNALEALRAYDWPGNVRELRNVVERATILAQGKPLAAKHFTMPRGGTRTRAELAENMELPEDGLDLEKLEANLIRLALKRTRNNKTHAARLLGMTRRTLYSRMEKHGIPVR
jgi:two-component system NtrC family response regulator